MLPSMAPEVEDVLNFIRVRIGRGWEVRLNHVTHAFPQLMVVDIILSLERAGYLKTRGARGRRLELTEKGLNYDIQHNRQA